MIHDAIAILLFEINVDASFCPVWNKVQQSFSFSWSKDVKMAIILDLKQKKPQNTSKLFNFLCAVFGKVANAQIQPLMDYAGLLMAIIIPHHQLILCNMINRKSWGFNFLSGVTDILMTQKQDGPERIIIIFYLVD